MRLTTYATMKLISYKEFLPCNYQAALGGFFAPLSSHDLDYVRFASDLMTKSTS